MVRSVKIGSSRAGSDWVMAAKESGVYRGEYAQALEDRRDTLCREQREDEGLTIDLIQPDEPRTESAEPG